jgi:hypothetical protein
MRPRFSRNSVESAVSTMPVGHSRRRWLRVAERSRCCWRWVESYREEFARGRRPRLVCPCGSSVGAGCASPSARDVVGDGSRAIAKSSLEVGDHVWCARAGSPIGLAGREGDESGQRGRDSRGFGRGRLCRQFPCGHSRRRRLRQELAMPLEMRRSYRGELARDRRQRLVRAFTSALVARRQELATPWEMRRRERGEFAGGRRSRLLRKGCSVTPSPSPGRRPP